MGISSTYSRSKGATGRMGKDVKEGERVNASVSKESSAVHLSGHNDQVYLSRLQHPRLLLVGF